MTAMTAGRAPSSILAETGHGRPPPATPIFSFPFRPRLWPRPIPGSFFCAQQKTAANRSGLRLAAVLGMVPDKPVAATGAEGLPNARCGKTASVIATDHAVRTRIPRPQGTGDRGIRRVPGISVARVGGRTSPAVPASCPPARRPEGGSISRRSAGAGHSSAGRYRPRPGSCGNAACSIRHVRA